MNSTGGLPNAVSRRTLIAGAAWAVPTVAVLSATPAFAASASSLATAIDGIWSLNYNNGPGPLGFNFRIGNYSSPQEIDFSYTVTILKPDGTSDLFITSSGSLGPGSALMSGDLAYPNATTKLPSGSYTVSLSVTSGRYKYSAVARSMTI